MILGGRTSCISYVIITLHYFRFELYNIEYWGKSIPGQLVKEFPAQIVKGLAAEIYDLMMDDEQKIEGKFFIDYI